MANVSKSVLIQKLSQALSDDSAALFVGAGLSKPAGFVDWRALLRDIAEEIGLDIDRESDLVSIAQFHVNEFGGKGGVNQVLIDEFVRDAVVTPNHRLIASLPIESVWTTNYDDLLERGYRELHKRPDVKTSVANISHTVKGRDVVIYKMHGDRQQPQEAILTREDYETFESVRGAFSIALKGDLLEKTFLFLGFSFTDPNIDHILARIKGLLGTNQRDHYCIMKWPDQSDTSPAGLAEYQYNRRRLELRIGDLSRYHIHAVMIESYSEIQEILEALNKGALAKDIFVSGSAQDYAPLGEARVQTFLHNLGAEIVRRGFRLVSGFGRGIGNFVAYGALHKVYSDWLPTDSVTLLPFPHVLPPGTDKTTFYSKHREMMISRVGFSIFICGNRSDSSGAPTVGPGILEEFAITDKLRRFPIPFGASGWGAEKIWNQVMSDPKHFYGSIDVTAPMTVLGSPGLTDNDYIEAIFAMIKKLSK